MPNTETTRIIRLLREVNNRNILVWCEDNELKIKFKKGDQPDTTLLLELKKNKERILNYLRNVEENKLTRTLLTKRINSICEPIPEQVFYDAMHQQKKEYLRFVITGTNTSNLRFAIRVQGLQNQVLERVLDSLFERHESLRTTFGIVDGRIVQKIKRFTEKMVKIEHVDLIECSREEIAHRINKLANRISFDLEEGPLVDVKVIHEPEAFSVMLFTIHHVISDGGSIDVLKKEIAELYRSYSENRTNPLAPLKLQFKDYSAWIDNLFESPEGREARLRYEEQILDSLSRDEARYKILHGQGTSYKEELEKEMRAVLGNNGISAYPEALGTIVTLKPGPGASYNIFLDENLSDRLKNMAIAWSASLFVTFIAGFSILFSDAHKKNVRISVPFSTRVSKEFEAIVGWLTHNLIICVDINDQMGVGEFVRYVNNIIWDSADFRFFPHEQIMESLDVPLNALAPVYINLLKAVDHSIPDFRAYHSDKGSGIMDLKCIVNECKNGIAIQLHYNTGKYARKEVEDLGRRYVSILNKMTDSDHLSVREL